MKILYLVCKQCVAGISQGYALYCLPHDYEKLRKMLGLDSVGYRPEGRRSRWESSSRWCCISESAWANHNLNRKDFSLCTPFQYFPPRLITCAQPVTVREGYFRAANSLEPIFSEKFSRELNAFAGTNSDLPATV